jgi:hypothetical protein
MSIFQKKLGVQKPATKLGQLVEYIQNQVNQNGSMVSNAAAQAAIATENLNDNAVRALSTAQQGLSLAIEEVTKALSIDGITEAQMDAATAAGIMAGDVKGFLNRSINPIKVSTEGFQLVNLTADDAVSERMSLEAYDERENRNAAVYSIAYNMQAARQDEFGETLFPTIVVTPDNVGFIISVRLMMVYDELNRNVSGALANYNKKNIIRAIADPTILKNEATRVIPVNRAESLAKFVAAGDVAPYAVSLEGESIQTAPLKVGVAVDLIGISQTDALLANGVMDITDSLDPAVVLQNVYVKVGNDVMKFTTQDLPLSAFNYTPQNNYRVSVLNFETKSALITLNTKKVDGAALAGAALALVAAHDYSVRVKLVVNGQINIETGETTVFGNLVATESVKDSSGNDLSLTAAGDGKTIADALNAGAIIGYDLKAYRSNANRRQRGQLIDTTYFNQAYNVALRSPITAIHPVTTDGQNDAADLNTLITTTRIRTSNAAVTALLDAATMLAGYVDARDAAGVGPDVLGVGRWYVRPTYFHEAVDMNDIVDSIQSHQRAADIQAALVNKVRDHAYNMYRDSEYKAAADALAGGLAPVPVVIVATDPVIARYLNVVGDLRTLGGEFDVRVVSSLDHRVAGKIFVTFGVFDESRNTTPNPLNFGNMAWTPELTVTLPISRNGQISKETAVQPRFLHVVHLPVLSVLEVANIPDVTNKVTLNMHSIV